jgi:hypothetical protein
MIAIERPIAVLKNAADNNIGSENVTKGNNSNLVRPVVYVYKDVNT